VISVLKAAGAAALLSGAAVVADATMVEPYRLTTTRLMLPEGALSHALGGERIVHLSDLHLHGMGSSEERLAAAVAAEDPGLIVMTGDYADTSAGVSGLSSLVSRLHARLGVVAVPGNNDYFRGRQEEIFATLRSAGVTVLRNASMILQGPGGRFAVAGVDDPFFGRDDLRRALAGIPEGTPTLLLAHSPAVEERRSEAMLFNAGDPSGAWGAGWFWLDGSHLRGRQPDISFESGGSHTLRLQGREDGAGVGEIRLIPATDPELARYPSGDHSAPPRTSGEIDLDPCDRGATIHGAWTLNHGSDGLCVLHDGPDRGRLAAFPKIEPADRAEISFEAPAGVAYRIWVRIFSPASTGRSDSVYLQFSDSVDPGGAPRYRIGSALPLASGSGVALVLAGHTHGGQVRLPWLGALEKNISGGPFVMGRYDIGGTMLYISRGLGTSYLPVRFDCPPEVVVLTPPADEQRGGPRA